MKIVLIVGLALVAACNEAVRTSDVSSDPTTLPPYNRNKQVKQRITPDGQTFRDDRPDIAYRIDQRDTLDLANFDSCGLAFLEVFDSIYCVRNGGDYDYVVCAIEGPIWPDKHQEAISLDKIKNVSHEQVWKRYLSTYHRPSGTTCDLRIDQVRAIFGPPSKEVINRFDEIIIYSYDISLDWRRGPCPQEYSNGGPTLAYNGAFEYCHASLFVTFDYTKPDSTMIGARLMSES